VVKKPFWETMTIYISSIVSWSLANTLTPKNNKSRFLVTELSPINRDMFTDENFSSSVASGPSVQDNENLYNSGFPVSHTSNTNLDISSQPSTSGLNTSRPPSKKEFASVEIKTSPKARGLRIAGRIQGWVLL
jgi:hypothetical protein